MVGVEAGRSTGGMPFDRICAECQSTAESRIPDVSYVLHSTPPICHSWDTVNAAGIISSGTVCCSSSMQYIRQERAGRSSIAQESGSPNPQDKSMLPASDKGQMARKLLVVRKTDSKSNALSSVFSRQHPPFTRIWRLQKPAISAPTARSWQVGASLQASFRTESAPCAWITRTSAIQALIHEKNVPCGLAHLNAPL